MLKCREVSRIVATGEIEELPWMKRIEMRLHLMMCNHCREYLAQIFALGRGVRRIFGLEEDAETLARLERKILADGGCGHDHHD